MRSKIPAVFLLVVFVAACSIAWPYLSPSIPRVPIGQSLDASTLSSDADGDFLQFRFLWIRTVNVTPHIERDVILDGIFVENVYDEDGNFLEVIYRGEDTYTPTKTGNWQVRVFSTDGESWSHEHVGGTRPRGEGWHPFVVRFPEYTLSVNHHLREQGWELQAVVQFKAE